MTRRRGNVLFGTVLLGLLGLSITLDKPFLPEEWGPVSESALNHRPHGVLPGSIDPGTAAAGATWWLWAERDYIAAVQRCGTRRQGGVPWMAVWKTQDPRARPRGGWWGGHLTEAGWFRVYPINPQYPCYQADRDSGPFYDPGAMSHGDGTNMVDLVRLVDSSVYIDHPMRWDPKYHYTSPIRVGPITEHPARVRLKGGKYRPVWER